MLYLHPTISKEIHDSLQYIMSSECIDTLVDEATFLFSHRDDLIDLEKKYTHKITHERDATATIAYCSINSGETGVVLAPDDIFETGQRTTFLSLYQLPA